MFDNDDDVFPRGGFQDLLSDVPEMERTLPRFLFRGFCVTAQSWNKLNSIEGVYAYAFRPDLGPLTATGSMVNGGNPTVPKNVGDLSYEELRWYADRHCAGATDTLSPFTSWSANLSTAIFFALGSYAIPWNFLNEEEGFICILEVHAFLKEGERGRRIFHVPNIADPRRFPGLTMEYLVYGEVVGSAWYKSVRISQIRDAISCHRFPFCALPARIPHEVTREEAGAAIAIGRLFQSASDTTMDRTLAVMAAILAWQQRHVASPAPLSAAAIVQARHNPPVPLTWPPGSLDVIKCCLQLSASPNPDILVAPQRLLPPLSQFPIVNRNVVTTGAPELQLSNDLLHDLQLSYHCEVNAGTPKATTRRVWELAVRLYAGLLTHTCPP